MRNAVFPLLAVLCCSAGAAFGQPSASEITGAWECRMPGQSTRTPPILWIAPAQAQGGPETYEVDGFSGVVRTAGRFASGAGGWSQLEPAGGVALWVKPASDGRRSGLLARLGPEGRPYLCLRLPYPRA